MPPPSFTFIERPNSRSSTSEPPTINLSYLASGETDDSLVRVLALAATAPIQYSLFGQLFRQDLKLDPDGYARYIVTVPYGTQNRDVGSFNFSFDTTGGTAKIKAAKRHITAFMPIGEDDNDLHHGAIGVTSDMKVEGTDIAVPALKVAYTFKHPQGIVTEDFMMGLSRITGYFNRNPWRQFDAGEALFVGATGSGGTNTESEVTYNIIGSRNYNGDLSIGNIFNIVKRGHDYAWVEFLKSVDAGNPAVRPIRVNIEQVYDDPIDFATYFGWE